MKLKMFFFVIFVILFSGCGSESGNSSDSLSYSYKVIKINTQNNSNIIGNIEINTSGKYPNIKMSNFKVLLEGCNNIKSYIYPNTLIKNGILTFDISLLNNFSCEGRKNIIIKGIESAVKLDSDLIEINKNININIPVYLYKKNNILNIETNMSNVSNIENTLNIENISSKIENINILKTSEPSYDDSIGLMKINYIFQLVGNKGKLANTGGSLKDGIIVNNKLNAIGNNGKILFNNLNTLFIDDNKTINYFIEPTEDVLIILPNKNKYNPLYLGEWDINKIINEHTIELNNELKLSLTENNLSYVIGNNRKVISNQLLSASLIDANDNNKSRGIFSTTLMYNPQLSGHTGFLYVTFFDDSNRIGNAQRIKFLPLKLIVYANDEETNYTKKLNNSCVRSYIDNNISQCQWEFNSSTGFNIHYEMNIGNGNIIDAKNIPISLKNFQVNDKYKCILKINGHYLDGSTVYTSSNGDISAQIDAETNCTITYKPDIDYEY